MSKALIAIHYYDSIEPAVMAAAMQLAIRHGTVPCLVKARPADHALNLCVKMFLRNTQFTHVFSIDSDTEPPLDALQRLLDLNADVASGVYRLNIQEGLRWAVLDKQQDGKYYLQEKLTDETKPYWADAAGTGCLLIRRGVLENMAWPWFRFIEHEDLTQETEDVFFAKKCNAMGVRYRIDPAVRCVHHKTIGLL